MQTIYKYPIDNVTNTIITAPIIKPLRVDHQPNSVDKTPNFYLWAVVDIEKPSEEWIVSCVGTGWDNEKLGYQIDLDTYLDTTIVEAPFGMRSTNVWHWFCRKYVQGFDL